MRTNIIATLDGTEVLMGVLQIDIKECLRTILQIKKITAYQFARENGLPKSSVSYWLHGREPKGKTLLWIYNYSEKLKNQYN